ncbi:ABC transporter ATP-binding protein [Desulfurivibrio alkaliphilus]|uniref:ABC transporter related protein n=1 Tax=Desulfurivibrio alkaliphilus (strain DSM 19089 / UNIQEM U267 / AHT2) TaxID=589865 RepID=D6Z5C7_DESAT|nr:ABC transporter ATP-binding protein [Desulfurivibrio alkaliphilus]ADH84784.1 ABC transporter related protein [Desulfurivibrio alkaliphilus AHT 2]
MPNATTNTPAIDCRDLRFRWHRGGPLVLDLPALRVDRGEKVFIAGPSGSGKTTLLSLLTGVGVAETGRVKVLGQDLAALSGSRRDHFRADHLGYIFQLFNLLPYLSLLENVLLPCRFSRRRRENAGGRPSALRAEALRLLAHLDLADPRLLRQPVAQLSVGQQQRVAAARALIGGPELVIADEPTSSLDMDRRESFVKLLFAECARQGATLVMVSHDHSLEHLFDRSIQLAAINRAQPDVAGEAAWQP